jgi:hypothetical protein
MEEEIKDVRLQRENLVIPFSIEDRNSNTIVTHDLRHFRFISTKMKTV